MKLTIILVFSISLSAQAQEFRVHQLEDESTGVSTVLSGSSPRTYLRPEKRDKILKRFFPDQMKEMDEDERDLFYKRLLFYSPEDLFGRYPFLRNKNIKEIKHALD
jgi:hypothetical protein